MSSLKDVFVPLGHKGVILTCVAFGSPTPSVEWLKNGQVLDTQKMTSVIENPGESVFVTAKLVLHGYEFTQSDGGNYSCVTQAGSNTSAMSKHVLLKPRLIHNVVPTPVRCSLTTDTSLFQFRLPGATCSVIESIKEMKNVLQSVIVSECWDCSAYSEIIILKASCSKDSVLVNGNIKIANISKRENIFCALNSWKNRGPLIQINSRFYLVDRLYPIISDGSILKIQGQPNVLSEGIADVILLLVFAVLSTALLFQSLQLKRKKR